MPDSVPPPTDPGPAEPVRLPPNSLDAEQGVLGSMMLSKDAIADVVEVLRPRDFYRPAHQTIFDAVLRLYGGGEPADAVTVAAELTGTGELHRVGGGTYLHTLIASVTTPASAGWYAEIVADRAVKRRLVEAGTRITQYGFAETIEADEAADRAQAEVYAATEHRLGADYIRVEELVGPTMDELEAIGRRGGGLIGIPTGFYDLDRLLHGLRPGQMVTVAGRPGAGKSTLGLDFCRSASIRHSLTSAVFSLEMSRSEITMRMMAAEAGVSFGRMQAGELTDDDWGMLAHRMGEVSEAPLYVDDSPNLTMMEIRAKARRLAQRHDLRLIVIDYMQLMSSGKRVESRQVEVSEYSRSIKLLAKELAIPVVAISQLNRQNEQRMDKRPMLSDLRESGAIEQDSDVVILVHRDDMYDKTSPRAGVADLIVAKHRNGPTRDVEVAFQGHYSRFKDLAPGQV